MVSKSPILWKQAVGATSGLFDEGCGEDVLGLIEAHPDLVSLRSDF